MKNMSLIVSELIRELPTTEERSALLATVEKAKLLIFSRADSAAATLTALPQVVVAQMPESVRQDTTALDNWLRDVCTELSAYASTVVTIPYIPTIQQTTELVKKIRHHLGETILIELKTDPTLIAGIRVEHAGKRSEYSLAKELNEQKN